MKNMYDKGSYFCRIHDYLHPYNSWDIEKIELSYEDWRRKDNGEGKEVTPSFYVGERKISAEEGDVVNDDKVYFGSYAKEEKILDMKSSFELPNELEDKPPPAGCELGNPKEKNNYAKACTPFIFFYLLEA